MPQPGKDQSGALKDKFSQKMQMESQVMFSKSTKRFWKTLKKQPRKHKMAPYSSSAVIQVLTDPRLIWTDIIYSMFKSQIIIITVAAWAWSRVEGFKRRLFKSVWNISASGDFDFSDFLQLCTLVSLRSSRNVSFTSNPEFSIHTEVMRSQTDFWVSFSCTFTGWCII